MTPDEISKILELSKTAINILYIVITILVVIVSAGVKLVWHLSKTDSKIDNAIATGIRAHKRIDILDDRVFSGVKENK